MNNREAGIRLVRECVAGENAQDYDRMYSVFTPELTFYLNGSVLASGKREVFAGGEEATTPSTFGNAHRRIQWIDATDDRVVCQYCLNFTHVGTVFGFPATGNQIEVHGVLIAEHDGSAISAEHFFTDQGEMNRQLSGQVRTPGTAPAAPNGPPIPEAERARYEAVGERLARKLYECELARDVEGYVACYSDPVVSHLFGRQLRVPRAAFGPATIGYWGDNPGISREIEEAINLGNRTLLRWHLTADAKDGHPVSQHGAIVFEHDGERITSDWAYYPDLAQIVPTILQLG